jgi:hypothetical protein
MGLVLAGLAGNVQFVVATPARNFDAILVGYYEGHELMSIVMVNGGFTPALQDSVFKRDDALETLVANHVEFAPLAILYSFSTCNAVSTRAGASPSPPASRCR